MIWIDLKYPELNTQDFKVASKEFQHITKAKDKQIAQPSHIMSQKR